MRTPADAVPAAGRPAGPLAGWSSCSRRRRVLLGAGWTLSGRALAHGGLQPLRTQAGCGFLKKAAEPALGATGAGLASRPRSFVPPRRRRNPFRVAAGSSAHTARANRWWYPPSAGVLAPARRGRRGRRCCVSRRDSPPEPVPGVDFQISDLRAAERTSSGMGLPLPPGKLPNDLLKAIPRLNSSSRTRRSDHLPGRRRRHRRRGCVRRGGPGAEVRPHHLRHRRHRAVCGAGQRQRHRHSRRRAPLAVDDAPVSGRQHAVPDLERGPRVEGPLPQRWGITLCGGIPRSPTPSAGRWWPA
ncbi:MAG: hypothetical protein MZV70_60550 [Desulfobacterales bacterium]|nr:hypothetical protein [Desulfobacterales bacterium]